jgi:asparagine synthase (glutamine-hydrolysing)
MGRGQDQTLLTYSGGLSRSYSRTYAPAHHFGFRGFSPLRNLSVIAVAEGIPFIALTDYDVERLYQLKGEIVARGVKAITGFDMPVFAKRRFQHGAVSESTMDSAASLSRGGVSPEISFLYTHDTLSGQRAAERDAWILGRRPAREPAILISPMSIL